MSTEADFIEQAKLGNVSAFAELVRLHQARIRAFLGRHLRSESAVDDVAQECFLAAFQSLATFDGRAPLRNWLFGIARNQMLLYLREECRRLQLENEPLDAAVSAWAEENVQSENEEKTGDALKSLDACVEKLPQQSAAIVREYYFESRNTLQIAERLGRTENAVRILLFRIRQQLRDCMESRAALEGTHP